MAKRGLSPELTRENIRREAARLFEYNGVHATSLMDIAQAAGISKGTLYYHYAAKETLVLEIASEHFSLITSRVYEWIDALEPGAGGGLSLETLAERIFPDADTMRLHFALISEAVRDEGNLRAFVSSKHKEWAVILELGVLRLAPPGRFKQFGSTVVSLINTYAMQALLGEQIEIGALLGMIADRLG